MLDVLDIASDADAVRVNLVGHGDHAHSVIVAVSRDCTGAAVCDRACHHAADLTRPSTTCSMLCTEAKVDFLSTSSGNSMSEASSRARITSTDAGEVRPRS